MKRLLLVDIGNSTVKYAYAGKFEETLNVIQLENWIWNSVLPDAENTFVCSVVPQANRQLVEKYITKRNLFMASYDFEIPIPNKTDFPEEVGHDRLVAAFAANRITPGDNIIISCGTALVFSIVRDGQFVGGNILPGPTLQWRALHSGTSLLPLPKDNCLPPAGPPLGASTESAIANGIAHGLAGGVRFLVRQYRAELDKPHIYLTGGWAEWLQPFLNFDHSLRPHLVLVGLEQLATEVLAGLS